MSWAAGAWADDAWFGTSWYNIGSGSKSGGRTKGKRRRYIVEVDGEFIPVASQQEAEDVLLQVRELAQESAERDVKTEVVPKPPRVSIKTAAGKVTKSKRLNDAIEKTQKTITQAYTKVAKDIEQSKEIEQLINKTIEEESLITMLLMY